MFVWVYLGLSTAVVTAVNCYQTATKPATLWPENGAKPLVRAAPPAGFEPATRRLEGGRSNPLSYGGLPRP